MIPFPQLKSIAAGLLLFVCPLTALVKEQKTSGVEIEYAQNLSIHCEPWGYLVKIKDPASDNTREYYLVLKGEIAPDEMGNSVIPIPVERMAALSTTYLGPLLALGAEDRLAAIESRSLIWSPTIRYLIEEGRIGEVGPSHRMDLEALIHLKPDLVLFSRIDSGQLSPAERLQRMGIPSIATSAWQENSPLGRAEWIKLFGLLTGKESEAMAHFNKVQKKYDQLRNKVAPHTSKVRPLVLASAPHGGTWYLAGGQSYTARLIEDAGGNYIWSDLPGHGSSPVDFEAAYAKAFQADFWINPGSHRRLSSLGSSDRRYERLPVFQSGSVYNHTKRMAPGGANDYWERAAVHPEEVLADLITIFHPNLAESTEFIYYEKLAP